MTLRLRWTSLALKDLEDIRDYIRKDKPVAAKKEALKIRKSVEKLSRFPRSGRLVKTIPSVREVIAGNYHVYYCLRTSQIQILRVYHGKIKLL